MSAWISVRIGSTGPPVLIRIAEHRAYCRRRDLRGFVRVLLSMIDPQPGYLPDRDGAAARELVRQIRFRFGRVLTARFVRSNYARSPEPLGAVY